MSDFELTDQQAAALDAVKAWLSNGAPGGVFRLGGYAGTGKTTIAKHLTDRPVMFGAYTGKAVQVLRSKGLYAETLHRLMYLPNGGGADPEVARLVDQIRNTIDEKRRHDLAIRLRKLTSGLSFSKNEGAPLAMLYEDNGVLVVDEASMVDNYMAEDLLSFGVPVIALGDPMQLPPIGGDKGALFAPDQMNVMLTDIKRQNGELADALNYVREYKRAPESLYRTKLDRLDADQLIVWTNRKRWETIEKTRRMLGRDPKKIEVGDKIIVTMNNLDLDVFNGQQFEVLVNDGRARGTAHLAVRDIVTNEQRQLTVWTEGFHGFAGESALNATPYREQKAFVCATFAQAITCHKAQGSEWDKVIVVEEPGIRDKSKWLYTAVTRAREAVKVVKPAPDKGRSRR